MGSFTDSNVYRIGQLSATPNLLREWDQSTSSSTRSVLGGAEKVKRSSFRCEPNSILECANSLWLPPRWSKSTFIINFLARSISIVACDTVPDEPGLGTRIKVDSFFFLIYMSRAIEKDPAKR